MFKIIAVGAALVLAFFISPWLPAIGAALIVGHQADGPKLLGRGK